MGPRAPSSRLVAWLTPAIAAVALVLAPVAQAQERPWSLRNLFKPRQQMLWPAPPPPATKHKPSARKPATGVTSRRTTTVETREPEAKPEIVEKAASARVVLVIGDFIAGAAAEGIDAIFAQDPTVRIVDRSKGASGLVRTDHYDWTQEISAIIAEVKPSVVVIALGANDRQTMSIGDKKQPLRSEEWMREYQARTASLLSEIQMAGAPVIWLGTPSFKSSRMNADILAFNEIYRKTAADAGIEYAEVWDGFVDEKGSFVVTGPDVNGQPVRLRTEDGINLTAAGKRKLAFYAEKSLRALLGSGGASPPVGDTTGPVVAAPNRTVPIALSDPALDGGEVLLGGSGQAPIPPISSYTEQADVVGRADDFQLPGTHSASAGKETPDKATTSSLRGTMSHR